MAFSFDTRTQSILCPIVSKADRARLEAHPLRRGQQASDFAAQLVLRALNQPELVRQEEDARGALAHAYYLVEVETVTCPDAEREVFHIVLRIIRGPFVGRAIVVTLWYPTPETSRRGPHQHFNMALGLGPNDRLFGRELELEGRQLLVKYWRETTPDGLVAEEVRFSRPAREDAAA